jgi:hypothetical protein
MTPTVIVISGFFAISVLFCLMQFMHLMRRRDDEFPGKFDKPIWAAAIFFGNVFGAFVYWLLRPIQAPESKALEREFASAIKRRAALSGGAAPAE